MKKLFFLIVVLIPFGAFAEDQKPSIDVRITKLEAQSADYKDVWEGTKKMYGYYNTFVALFLVLWGAFSYLWVRAKNTFSAKLEKLNNDMQTNSLLAEIEQLRISCKNFVSLSSGDGKSSVFLDFDPYIAQVGTSLIDTYEKVRKGKDISTYLLVEDLLALGDASYHNQDFDTALDFYTRASEKSRFNPQIYYNIAFSYLEKRLKFGNDTDEKKELENFKKALHYGEFDFKNSVWMAIALANSNWGEVQRTEETVKQNLDRAVALDSNLAKNMIKQYASQGYFGHHAELPARYA